MDFEQRLKIIQACRRSEEQGVQWSRYGRTSYPVIETFLSEKLGTRTLNPLLELVQSELQYTSGDKPIVVADFFAGPERMRALAQDYYSLNPHQQVGKLLTCSFGLTDTRSQQQIAEDNKLYVNVIAADLGDPKTLQYITAFFETFKFSIGIAEPGVGAIDTFGNNDEGLSTYLNFLNMIRKSRADDGIFAGYFPFIDIDFFNNAGYEVHLARDPESSEPNNYRAPIILVR